MPIIKRIKLKAPHPLRGFTSILPKLPQDFILTFVHHSWCRIWA